MVCGICYQFEHDFVFVLSIKKKNWYNSVPIVNPCVPLSDRQGVVVKKKKLMHCLLCSLVWVAIH